MKYIKNYIYKWVIIMVIIGVMLIGLAFLLIIRESRASAKRKILENTRKIIKTDTDNKKSGFYEGMEIGLGAGGLTLLDIYASVENHENVLNVLEQRYPHEVGDLNPFQWFNKIEELYKNDAVSNYVGAYAGQAGENAALGILREQGYSANLFNALNHPNDDIFASIQGHDIAYSVKSGSVNYIESSIKEHPESAHYIINSEAYNQLEHNGLIAQNSKNGIEIINGKFSNNEFRGTADHALQNIHETGDVANHIPLIALAVFGIKTINNIKDYNKFNQNGYELGVNVTGDLMRIGSRGLFATGGAKFGAAVGTILVPGLGTVIGGGVGAIIGAITGGNIVNWSKERFKWGKIINAIEHFGNRYENNFGYEIIRQVQNKFLQLGTLEKEIANENMLLSKYENQLDPYKSDKVTIAAVMCKEHSENLIATHERINNASKALENGIYVLCGQAASTIFPKNKKKQVYARKRFLGDLLLSNSWLFKNENLSVNERILMSGYNEQIIKAPNHPYKFQVNSTELLKEYVIKTFMETPLRKRKDNDSEMKIWVISFLLITVGLLIIILK